MFSVDVPTPPGMKLDHFRPDGRHCYFLDHITPGPTIPSKIHPAQAGGKGEELTEPISRKKKRRCNKKIYNLVPTLLGETTSTATAYESNTFCQIAIAESLSKV